MGLLLLGIYLFPHSFGTQVKASVMRFIASSSTPKDAIPCYHSHIGTRVDRDIVATVISQCVDAVKKLQDASDVAKPDSCRSDERGDISQRLSDHYHQTDDNSSESGIVIPVVHPPSANDIKVTFNKMSGMQEFQNSMALFVNLDQSTYNNLFITDHTHDAKTSEEAAEALRSLPPAEALVEHFSRGKLLMTFYAQPRHKVDSPVIKRLMQLLQHGAPAAGEGDVPAKRQRTDGEGVEEDHINPLESVMLFCRLPNCPYMYWGRIDPVAVAVDQHPIKFIFEVSELPRLLQSVDFLNVLLSLDVLKL
jgi:hypothetical protein